MTEQKNVTILAFVGLAGTGKSSAVDYLTEQGYPKVYFGGIMYKAAAKAGVRPGDWDAEKEFREKLRIKEGKDFIAKRAIAEANDLIAAGQRRIIFDGIYSWTEYKTIKHAFPGELIVVATVTPRQLRYKRMANRTERPMTAHEVDERDWAEIENIEKGGPIAVADYFIINDGSLEQLHANIDTLVNQIAFHE